MWSTVNNLDLWLITVARKGSTEEQNRSIDHDRRAMKARIYYSKRDLREKVFKDASETVQHIKSCRQVKGS